MVDGGLHPGRDATSFVPHPHLDGYYRPGSGERRRFVNELFDETAFRYDWINRFMSLGAGASYRRDVLKRAGLSPGHRVLDVATGTGLVAREAQSLVGHSSCVVGIDFSLGMLREAKRHLSVPLVRGLAERLPVAGSRFDFVTMGYALRHVDDLGVTFRECHRVLKPGGRLVLLEVTRPSSRVHYRMARLYLKHFVPFVAGIGSGGKKAETLMTYFWDTIEHCVPPETVLLALERSGFAAERSRLLGVLTDYVAVALKQSGAPEAGR